jgi:hypothetical protein
MRSVTSPRRASLAASNLVCLIDDEEDDEMDESASEVAFDEG